ncbi:hypothetical protein L1987_41537 [Smallanthus sonchifolius]|uniref:Uncharacterized protein n=1 Tax=Smallanthus sonchifolius TaxID=185202 RepID=A0ACB9GVM2_9ASTR|nr:hypothetical protein L1987_41537 [Smallanthus sonchifolius]
MAIVSFTTIEKTNHNSYKFGFTLSPSNYRYWKTMIKPFLITNGLYVYIDGSLSCPPKTIVVFVSSSEKDSAPSITQQLNPDYSTWASNDAHVRMLLLAYAPHTSSREYTLKTQLLKMSMQSNETSAAYITRAQEYNDALANIGAAMPEKDMIPSFMLLPKPSRLHPLVPQPRRAVFNSHLKQYSHIND